MSGSVPASRGWSERKTWARIWLMHGRKSLSLGVILVYHGLCENGQASVSSLHRQGDCAAGNRGRGHGRRKLEVRGR